MRLRQWYKKPDQGIKIACSYEGNTMLIRVRVSERIMPSPAQEKGVGSRRRVVVVVVVVVVSTVRGNQNMQI